MPKGTRSIILFIFFAIILLGFFWLSVREPGTDSKEGQQVTPQAEPTITFIDPTRGSPEAKVTIIEFGDFQCEACLEAHETLEEILEDYRGKVRLIWKDFPIEQLHPMATKSAIAARCAQRQNMFWEMHDALFAIQNALSDNSIDIAADTIGLDPDLFDACYENGETLPIVTKMFEEGRALGVVSTPSFFIGDRIIDGNLTKANWVSLIEQLLQ